MKYLLPLFLLISCGRMHPNLLTPVETKSVRLYLFSSATCTPCKEELPEIQRWHDLYRLKNRVKPIIFFIAGPANKPANQEDANAFASSLGLSFEIRADKYARFYRTIYKDGATVPALTITNEEGEIVKRYQPGKVSLEQLEADINKTLGEK